MAVRENNKRQQNVVLEARRTTITGDVRGREYLMRNTLR
jgi:hypothetical protein